MKSKEVREKFIKFFVSSPRNHKEISPAPLILENDPTTLFTSSGMQPLVPYLMGKSHPLGKRLVDSQPSIRTVDIDEVGDNRHLTFFEMLGNWSLGDYFKKEQLPWILDFFTKDLGLSQEKLWVSVFEGNDQVPKDEESAEIWKKLGIPDSRIYFYDAKKNWWSRTGSPDEMPIGEIGGPDSEIFYDFGKELKLHENSPFKNEECHPNCDCGRYMEIGNSVFMQYKKIGENKLEELPQKNVDFGGGLERIAAVVNGDPDIYKSDLFIGLINELERNSNAKYEDKKRDFRIIVDHIKASVFLVANGIVPSNKQHGYVIRRLLRRSAIKMHKIGAVKNIIETSRKVANQVVDTYKDRYLKDNNALDISVEIGDEVNKFSGVLDKGIKLIDKLINEGRKIDSDLAFDLFQTYGFPLEATEEYLESYGKRFTVEDKIKYDDRFRKHQEISRTTSAGIFKGGLADQSPEVIRLHTATHLLLAALRKVLGEHIVQKGQNITKDRSRFDFLHTQKLTDEEIKQVENLINDIVSKNLPVNFNIMPKNEAENTGAIHAFNEKYADTVKVYFVGDVLENAFSKEFCGGPHVTSTSEIGRVRIIKQDKVGSDIIRIYLTVE